MHQTSTVKSDLSPVSVCVFKTCVCVCWFLCVYELAKLYLCLWVDISAVVEKDFGHLDLVFLCCKVEWRQSALCMRIETRVNTHIQELWWEHTRQKHAIFLSQHDAGNQWSTSRF